MKKESKVNIGVIGVGRLGSFHIEQYQLLKNINIVGFYDIDLKKSKKIEKKYNIRSYSSINELINSCDGVSVATPTISHYKIAKQCILDDCHVLIEKPITKNIRQAKELVNLANKQNKIIQVGHVERFNPAFDILKNKIINPLFVESHRLSPFSIRGTDVDVILDLMIHDIDILLSLVKSKIIDIRASGASVLSKQIDTANARIEFKNGCVANITASRIAQKKMRKFRFFEKTSYTTIDFLHPNIEIYTVKNKKPLNESYMVMSGLDGKYIVYEKPVIKHYNALKKELENFLLSISKLEQPLIDGMSGLSALEVAIQIQDNIKTLNK